jgi:hypothetical protein
MAQRRDVVFTVVDHEPVVFGGGGGIAAAGVFSSHVEGFA